MKCDRSKGEAPMIYDCHLHTEFSGDSNTPISLQIEKAIELGMKEMCITDHHDYDSGFCDCDFILDISRQSTGTASASTSESSWDFRIILRNIWITL